MILRTEAIECPECGAAGSVVRGYCEVCSTELDTETARDVSFPALPVLHPSIPLRFADVIDELRTIASMAAGARHVQSESVAAACRRAESLLLVLRRQFLEDVTTSSLDGRSVEPTGPVRMFTSRPPSGRGRFTSPG